MTALLILTYAWAGATIVAAMWNMNRVHRSLKGKPPRPVDWPIIVCGLLWPMVLPCWLYLAWNETQPTD